MVVQTKPIPVPSGSSTMRYVIPGNGGGTGTEQDPFLGLQAAADQVQADEVIVVMDGTYEPFEIMTSGSAQNPIVFRAQNLHQAIIDGGNTDRGIITLGTFDDSLRYVIVDGFLIRNGRWGIDAQNTQFVTIRNNRIEAVDYGYVNRRANGWEHDQYITNNSFTGRTSWPQLNGGIPGERGIDIRGNNHTISYNYLTNFGDGISTDGPPYGVCYLLDIHHNDIINVVDDLIEVDGTVSNTHVYRNRGFNGRMGVSLAPILGGPCYVFRNEFYNMETSAYKLNRGPAGLVICHNTAVKAGNGMSSSPGFQNTYFRNNILMGSRYCFEEFGVVNGSIDDWDHNAYYSSRSATAGNEWFKWDNVRYSNVADLQMGTSLETNGLMITPSDLINTSVPSSYGTSYQPMNHDLSIASGSVLINNGGLLDHLNRKYVADGMPDIGAREYGAPVPRYGPDFDLLSDLSFVLSPDAIEIHPNPTNQFITLSGSLGEYHLRILDAEGTLIEEVENVGNHQTIDLSILGQGLYFIEISHASSQSLCVKTMIKM